MQQTPAERHLRTQHPGLSTRPVAVVTGASSGIGAAAARALAHAGMTVVLAARRVERLEALASRLNREGSTRAVVVAVDLTREAERIALFERARQLTGAVDVLVNNAGYSQPGVVEDLSLQELHDQFAINVFAAVHLMQLVIPGMRERGRGRIINISSGAGRLPIPGISAYSASKFALEAFSAAARVELAPFAVHVAIIAPGSVRTEIWEKAREIARIDDRSPYASLQQALLQSSRRGERFGVSPAVVARAIVHAATAPRPRARYPSTPEGWLIAAFATLPPVLRDPLLRRLFGLHGGRRR